MNADISVIVTIGIFSVSPALRG